MTNEIEDLEVTPGDFCSFTVTWGEGMGSTRQSVIVAPISADEWLFVGASGELRTGKPTNVVKDWNIPPDSEIAKQQAVLRHLIAGNFQFLNWPAEYYQVKRSRQKKMSILPVEYRQLSDDAIMLVKAVFQHMKAHGELRYNNKQSRCPPRTAAALHELVAVDIIEHHKEGDADVFQVSLDANLDVFRKMRLPDIKDLMMNEPL